MNCGLGRERSEEHTSELQSRPHLVCRLLLEKKKRNSGDTSIAASMPRTAQVATAQGCVAKPPCLTKLSKPMSRKGLARRYSIFVFLKKPRTPDTALFPPPALFRI